VSEQQPAGSIWTAWIIPLIIVAGLVAAFGLGLASVLEIPYAQACALAVPAVLAVGGYFFAEEWVYATASRRLGYRCELRPQPGPHSAQGDADLVITGTFRGHPFTLYRERHNSTSSYTASANSARRAPPIIRSVVEWAGPAFISPPFQVKVGYGSEAPPPDPFGIVSALESAVSAVRTASGHPSAPPLQEPAGFPKEKRDQLTEILGRGVVQGEPGYLVLRETPQSAVWTSRAGKFPYPWEIDEYLDRADRIRRVFAS